MDDKQSLLEANEHGTKLEPVYLQRFDIPKNDAFHIPRHWHHNIEFLHILSGEMLLEMNAESITATANDLICINSGDLHMITVDSTACCYDAVVCNPQIFSCAYPDLLQQTIIEPLLLHETVFPKIIKPTQSVHQKLCTLLDHIFILQENHDANLYFYTKQALAEMIYLIYTHQLFIPANSILSASDKDKIDRYKKMDTYIKQHISEEITLETLAKVTGCNAQYLCHFFKDFAGTSPIQYIIEQRIHYAQTLLEDTTKSILEISLICGFHHVSYFIKQFKKLTGYTPSTYRTHITKVL